MFDRSAVEEEQFGILTDDGLALEATLVRPVGLVDGEVKVVQVWVPKYPLTRGSVLPAARREIIALGKEHRMVNLAFDLRGSGDSGGIPNDEGFQIDLNSAHEWARERFGQEITFRRLGFPDMGGANGLLTLPLRRGVLAELYRYDPPGPRKATVVYFSQYGNFGPEDDELCRSIASGGFTVYGGDAMRYLFLAAPVTLDSLALDANEVVERLGQPFYLVGRAFSAGLALMMAIQAPSISGVVVTGPAQEGLMAPHLFDLSNPANFMLARHVRKLPPRPAVFLWNRTEAGSISPERLKSIHDLAGKGCLWGVVAQIDGRVLINALEWLTKQALQRMGNKTN